MKIIAIVICLSMSFGVGMPFSYAESNYTPPEQSKEELYQDIFVSLLMPHIEKAVDNYYKDFLTESPTVYPYFVDVLTAERIQGYRSFDFLVKLKVVPVVGPHIGVGIDHLTFRIGGTGTVEMTKFQHIKTFELPAHWKRIMKYR
ncbi:DUF3888 domain-containing protein [Brevibacillus borstelensis]|uniref:DUF3888 domain-containing protein n=1 Tax=Brevibacillus borstelensis TaxID=45462 RepID=UPI0030BFC2A4